MGSNFPHATIAFRQKTFGEQPSLHHRKWPHPPSLSMRSQTPKPSPYYQFSANRQSEFSVKVKIVEQ
jgi:hypothetical protein